MPAKEAFKPRIASDFATGQPPGVQQYLTSCAFCHGVHGEGLPGQISSLVRNGAVTAQGPQDVMRVVLGGLPATHGLAPMPAVGVTMSERPVTDVINYIRNALGNAAPAMAAPGLAAELRATTKSALAGNAEGGCPANSDPVLSANLSSSPIQQMLQGMTDENMLQVIDALLPKVRRAATHRSTDTLVNGLTNAYCSVLAAGNLPRPLRSTRLGNFATLVYGQLKSGGRE